MLRSSKKRTSHQCDCYINMSIYLWFHLPLWVCIPYHVVDGLGILAPHGLQTGRLAETFPLIETRFLVKLTRLSSVNTIIDEILFSDFQMLTLSCLSKKSRCLSPPSFPPDSTWTILSIVLTPPAVCARLHASYSSVEEMKKDCRRVMPRVPLKRCCVSSRSINAPKMNMDVRVSLKHLDYPVTNGGSDLELWIVRNSLWKMRSELRSYQEVPSHRLVVPTEWRRGSYDRSRSS